MVCAPSITAPRGGSSREAAEGHVAHDLAATCLQTKLDAHQVWLNVPSAHYDGFDIPITDEIREHVQSYSDYVRALGGALTVERTFRLSADFGGTADAIVLDDDTLHVLDFKYGKGVRVDAERNPQMLCYAVLALSEYGPLCEFKRIVLHVHQPRIGNVASWEATPEQVAEFERELQAAMKRALPFVMGEAVPGLLDYAAGEHCRFCTLAATCPGLREHATRQAQKVFGTAAEVPQSTLAEILRQAEVIDLWIGAVRKEAMDRALRGEVIEGFKLVQKRPVRKWAADDDTVRMIAFDSMIDPMTQPTLRSPADLEKLIGAQQFKLLFARLVEYVSSGLTLVAESDRRPAVDPATAATDKAVAVFSSVGESE
jgi:hypothetical protein